MHQYYELCLLEKNSNKNQESIQGMIEKYIHDKWNSSAWVISGYERPMSDDLPADQDPMKNLTSPVLSVTSVTGGKLVVSPSSLRLFACNNAFLLARMTASAKVFDNEMSRDHMIFSSSAAKRQKMSEQKFLPTSDDPIPLPPPPVVLTVLQPVETSTLDLSKMLGAWSISPIIKGFMTVDGNIGISTTKAVKMSAMALVLGKFGKGPFEWSDKLKDLHASVPYDLTPASLGRMTKKKSPPGPIQTVAEIFDKSSSEHPGLSMKYYDTEVIGGTMNMVTKRGLVLMPEARDCLHANQYQIRHNSKTSQTHFRSNSETLQCRETCQDQSRNNFLVLI